MNKFLEKYNLPRLNQEVIENTNRQITGTEVVTMIKNYHYGLLTCPTFDMWQGQLKNLEFFHFYSLNFDFNQTLMTAEI